jgi:hypothetical protein
VPWTLRVDPTNRVSYISFSGLVTFSDFADAQAALAADMTFDAAFPLLIDLRRATEIVLTRDDMHALVTLAAVAPTTKRAILVDGRGALSVAQVYESLRQSRADSDVLRACRTLKECTDWLGVELLDVTLGPSEDAGPSAHRC